MTQPAQMSMAEASLSSGRIVWEVSILSLAAEDSANFMVGLCEVAADLEVSVRSRAGRGSVTLQAGLFDPHRLQVFFVRSSRV